MSSACAPPKLFDSPSMRRTGGSWERPALASAHFSFHNLAIAVEIGVAVAGVHLRRLARRIGVVLVENQQRDLGILHRRQAADHAHLRIDDGMADPVEIFADVKFDFAFLHQADGERRAIE